MMDTQAIMGRSRCVHVITAFRGRKVHDHFFLTQHYIRQVVNIMNWPFHAQGNSMLYALNRELCGPSASQDTFGEEKSLLPLPGITPWIMKPPPHPNYQALIEVQQNGLSIKACHKGTCMNLLGSLIYIYIYSKTCLKRTLY